MVEQSNRALWLYLLLALYLVRQIFVDSAVLSAAMIQNSKQCNIHCFDILAAMTMHAVSSIYSISCVKGRRLLLANMRSAVEWGVPSTPFLAVLRALT